MASEQTPLLLQRVPVAPRRERYPHSTLRRFCTIALASILVVLVILWMIPLSFHLPHHAHRQTALSYEELQKILLDTPSEQRAREWSRYYTSGPHLAGKNLSQALWTKDRWEEFGVRSLIVDYDVYINYPLGHRLALLEDKSKSKVAELSTDDDNDAQSEMKKKADWKVKFEASLEEDVLKEDGTSGLDARIPTFHGYSASGNVTAGYVYANYGTYLDFEELIRTNISVDGKIVLAKYGKIFRGLKVKRAQELGAIGVILYSDPGDDGNTTEAYGNKTYPNGPAREPSSVQRGSVQYMSIVPGDPTTPGYPSKPGVPRLPANASTPVIPSIPISYLDAIPLLKSLNGHGPKASSISKYWEGGGLGDKGVEYNVGPSPDYLEINLVNEQEYVTNPIWNVIGIINGTIPDEVIILGNHRDAWIAGGAGDPNSGSAAFNEVIRSFGQAIEAGWKPLRTIVFASWDGEEYGLVGSTEWVEEFIPWLSAAAVAYLNVDVGAVGPYFAASASPVLNKALYEVTAMVRSPNQTVKGQSVRDTWDGKIRTMGSGSDFTAFQDFAGVPSLDMGFGPGPSSPIYHYHSNYDSFDWMDKYGDPEWHYHATIAKIWALLAAHMSEKPLIAFNVTDYSDALGSYLKTVEDLAEKSFTNGEDSPTPSKSEDYSSYTRSFKDLKKSIHDLQKTAASFDAYAADLSSRLDSDLPWWKWWKKVRLFWDIRKVNTAYKFFERNFLYAEGLDNRPWYKHVVFAPGIWTGYSGATFPGLVESVQAKDWTNAARWAGIIQGLVVKADEAMQ